MRNQMVLKGLFGVGIVSVGCRERVPQPWIKEVLTGRSGVQQDPRLRQNRRYSRSARCRSRSE